MALTARGFSFMELIVVLVVLAAMVAVVYPTMSTALNRARTGGAVREMSVFLKYAREKALAEQMATAVVLRPDQRDLTVFGDAPEPLRHYVLPGTVSFSRLVLDGRDVTDRSAVVWFYPDGRSTGVAMVLRDAAGHQYRLKTDILTGNTRIFSPGETGFEDEIFTQ